MTSNRDGDNVIPLPKPWYRSPLAEPRPHARVGAIIGAQRVLDDHWSGPAIMERCRRAAIKLHLEIGD